MWSDGGGVTSPLFPNMSCAEGLARDWYQNQTGGKITCPDLANPSLASCKAMKGAVCKRIAANLKTQHCLTSLAAACFFASFYGTNYVLCTTEDLMEIVLFNPQDIKSPCSLQ